MNPQCFACSDQATRVCIHPQCCSPPFFCSGQCRQGLSQKLHTHSGALDCIAYAEFDRNILNIKNTLDAPTFHKERVQKVRKQGQRVKDSFLEQIKKIDELVLRFEYQLHSELPMQLTEYPRELLKRVEGDFQGKSLNGKEIHALLKNENSFVYYKPRLAAIECFYESVMQELQKAKSLKTNIVFMSVKERQKKGQILYDVGEVLMKNRQWRQSLQKFQESRKVHNFNSLVYHKIGYCLQQLGQLDLAEQNYKKSLDLDPYNSFTINNIGYIYLQRKNYHQAIKYFDEAIEIDKKNIQAIGNRANSYLKLEMYEDAMQNYLSALQIEPCNQKLINIVADMGKMQQNRRGSSSKLLE